MSSERRIPRSKGALRIRQMVGVAALILIAFGAVIAYQDSQSYRQAIVKGEQDARRLTKILADHVELTFLDVDLALRRAIEQQYINSLFGNNLPQYMEQNFRVWLGEAPQIAGLALLNAKGELEVEAHKQNYDHWLDDVSSDLLTRMRDADERYVFIGVKQPKDKSASNSVASLIVMSRRFAKVNGEFGGIVVAAMDPQYFTEFYGSVAAGVEKFMSLTRIDGTVLSAGPGTQATNAAIVQGMVKQVGESEQIQISTNTVGKSIKIAAIKRLHNLVLVNVILEENDILAEWHQTRSKDFGFFWLFCLFVGGLGCFAIAMGRQIIRVEESERSALLASQAKSEFLANMSHELRTPLNAIIGFSEMLTAGYFGPMEDKQKERVHDINLCGGHLLQLISDILEYSKWEAGRLDLHEEAVNGAEIVDECARILGPKIKAKNIHFIASIEPGLPAVWADKRKVRQVMLNLLSNALKFTPEGGTIRVICLLDTQSAMNLIVSDNGIGIPEEEIPHALSVFGQVHRARSNEGTGLGLPLCKMYAELHGGELVLTSKKGEGTSVRIIFPHQRTLLNRKK